MHIKKFGIFGMLCTIVFGICVTKVYALPKVNSSFNSIQNLEGTNTIFGKLKLISNEESYDSLVVYHSNWAPWQNDITNEFISSAYQIYECEYFFDAPVKVYFSERYTPGQSISETEELTISYSQSSSDMWQNTSKAYGELCSNNSVELSTAIDIVKLKAVRNRGFKIGSEYVNSHISNTESSNTISYTYHRDHNYTNNHDYPILLRKNVRQRYKVIMLFAYRYYYDHTRTGSGLWGRDDNYSYTVREIVCQQAYIYFIPQDNPYFEYSEYKDKGYFEYVNDYLGNVIFA